ncbi:MAG TPA: bile acid:sodium symporter [Caulobacteraceae bacterium]|nr:bile acid:sodium symporter [Caulobacteraceae bacterium]
MDALKQLLPIIIQAGLALLVLSVGLQSTLDDLLYVLRRPALLGRAFVAISIVVPAAAVLAVNWLPLSLPVKVGVIMMSLAALPPFVPGSEIKAGGRRSYSYGLYAAFALLTVVIVPATVEVLDRLFGADAEVSLTVLGREVLLSVLLPLVVGMLIHTRWTALAERIAPVVSQVSMLVLIVIVGLLLYRAWPAMLSLIGNGTVLAVVVVSAAAIAAGHLLGGPDPRDKVALATAAAIRHPGIALMVANGFAPDKRVSAMILLYVLVTFVVVTIYQQAQKRLSRAPRGGGGHAAVGGAR